jgi:hypothetical protein
LIAASVVIFYALTFGITSGLAIASKWTPPFLWVLLSLDGVAIALFTGLFVFDLAVARREARRASAGAGPDRAP